MWLKALLDPAALASSVLPKEELRTPDMPQESCSLVPSAGHSCRIVRGGLRMWSESLQEPVSQDCAGPASLSDTLWPRQEQQPVDDGIPRLSPPCSGMGRRPHLTALGLSLALLPLCCSCCFTDVLSSFLSRSLCLLSWPEMPSEPFLWLDASPPRPSAV